MAGKKRNEGIIQIEVKLEAVRMFLEEKMNLRRINADLGLRDESDCGNG